MKLDSVGGETVELVGKSCGAATVLKEIGAEIDRSIKTGSVKFP